MRIDSFLQQLKKTKFWFPLLLVYLLILFRAISIPATDGKHRAFNYGDGPTDVNTISAIQFFTDHGFTKSAFRPAHNYSPEDKGNFYFYTHYPALPDVLWAAWSKLIGSTSEWSLRLGPLLLSLILLPLIFSVARLFVPTDELSMWATISLVTSSSYIFWADNLHKHLQEYLIFFSTILMFWSFYNSGPKTKRWIWLCLPIYSLWVTHSSFEAIVFVAFLSTGFSAVYNTGIRKLLSPLNVTLGLLFVLGFFLHMYLNSQVLGGWEAAIADMGRAAKERTGAGETQNPLILGLLNIFRYINRAERYFHLPGWLLAVLFVPYYHQLKARSKELAMLFLVITLAGFGWAIAMPQHAAVHHFTARHLGPVFLLMSPFAFSWLRDTVLFLLGKSYSPFSPAIPNFPAKTLGATLVIYGVIMFVTQSLLPTLWSRSGIQLLF